MNRREFLQAMLAGAAAPYVGAADDERIYGGEAAGGMAEWVILWYDGKTLRALGEQ